LIACFLATQCFVRGDLVLAWFAWWNMCFWGPIRLALVSLACVRAAGFYCCECVEHACLKDLWRVSLFLPRSCPNCRDLSLATNIDIKSLKNILGSMLFAKDLQVCFGRRRNTLLCPVYFAGEHRCTRLVVGAVQLPLSWFRIPFQSWMCGLQPTIISQQQRPLCVQPCCFSPTLRFAGAEEDPCKQEHR
jgi:hypothetical protein